MPFGGGLAIYLFVDEMVRRVTGRYSVWAVKKEKR